MFGYTGGFFVGFIWVFGSLRFTTNWQGGFPMRRTFVGKIIGWAAIAAIALSGALGTAAAARQRRRIVSVQQ